MKYFVGLDVSLQETAICVVDEDGIIVTEGKAASDPDDLGRWLAATGLAITRVGLEAGPYAREGAAPLSPKYRHSPVATAHVIVSGRSSNRSAPSRFAP